MATINKEKERGRRKIGRERWESLTELFSSTVPYLLRLLVNVDELEML